MFSSISDNFARNKRTRIKDEAEKILRATPKKMRNKKAITNALWKATENIYNQDKIAVEITKKEIGELVKRHFK